MDGRMDARMLDGIMKVLCEAELVVETVEKSSNPAGGRPLKAYEMVP